MKYHPHGTVLYVTSSIEEGVLFLCNPLCLALLQSCLSVALTNYPVDLCHFIVESTHIHMVLVVKNPEDVANFLKTFKCETTHMINGLLGRRKRTVWCEGYDSPIVLTPIRASIAISYLYSNPTKDNLTESIREYEGFSSWGMFMSGVHTATYKRLRRHQFELLPVWRQNPAGYKAEAEKLLSESNELYSFNLSPNAWLDAFGITDKAEQQKWNDRINARVTALEERAAKVRKRRGYRVIGPERLRRAMFDLTRRPKGRSGKRMLCLSENRRIRQQFISFLGDLMFAARQVARRWRLGDFSVPYPPGLYAPCMPRLANIMP